VSLTYVSEVPQAADSTAVETPPRELKRQATRDKLMVAALVEFRREGVAGAQIEKIVRAAGVARGTFYLHFPTREHVLLELLMDYQRQVAGQLDPSSRAEPRAFLRQVVHAMVECLSREDRELLREMFVAVFRHTAELADKEIELVMVLTAYLEEAGNRGLVRSELEAYETVTMLLPGLFGVMMLDEHEGNSLEALTRRLYRVVDVFAAGLAPPA
jgi:AcrR family transcriptional regulator